MRKPIVLSFAILWAAACTPRGNAVLVTVEASSALVNVAKLHAHATAGGQMRDFDVALKPGTIPATQSFGLDVPDNVSGLLRVHVTALDARGDTLASGDGATTLSSGHREAITIVLGAVVSPPQPDGGAGVDGGPLVVGVVGVLGQPCTAVGMLACSGNDGKLPIVCDGDRTWHANGTCSGSQNCDTTPGPTQGTCEPIVALCANSRPGDLVCDGLVRVRCGPDRVSTTNVEACAYVCTSSACIGECHPGSSRCLANAPQACDADGQWQGATACASQACVGGACQGVCVPGAMQCAGNVAQMCDASGAWQGTTPCPGGFCNGDGVCGVCATGSVRCDMNTPQTCDASGQWQGTTACAGQACVAGACTGKCVPGSKQCSNNTPQTCGPDGTWQSAAACAGQTCIGGACSGVCTAGTKSCSGSTPQTCDATGHWQPGTACPGGYCNGAGVCGYCATGARQCNGNNPQYCDSNGQWVTSASCQYVCSSGDCTGVCTPGVNNGCVYNGSVGTPAYCDSTGTWQAQPGASACCYQCYQGACQQPNCGYNSCTRGSAAQDAYCAQKYPTAPYYWYCTPGPQPSTDNCQTFGADIPASYWNTGGPTESWGGDVTGSWCMPWNTTC